jgi:vacuolar iron transporter family protein
MLPFANFDEGYRMTRLRLHPEHHLVGRIGWLRAAVLGANDGIVSTASLIVGVAAAAATQNAVLIAGVAGLVAGAMSMAAGEYVSVSSQSDTERADLARERKELSDNVEFEKEELAEIYIKRGLEPSLARQVAQQLMAKDALTAHARDELGLSEITTARPVQAALTSAATFAVGAAMPLLMVVISPAGALVPVVSAARKECITCFYHLYQPPLWTRTAHVVPLYAVAFQSCDTRPLRHVQFKCAGHHHDRVSVGKRSQPRQPQP